MNSAIVAEFEINDVVLNQMYEKLEAEEFRLGWGCIDEILAEYLSESGMLSLDYMIIRFEMSEVEGRRLMNFLKDNFSQYKQ